MYVTDHFSLYVTDHFKITGQPQRDAVLFIAYINVRMGIGPEQLKPVRCHLSLTTCSPYVLRLAYYLLLMQSITAAGAEFCLFLATNADGAATHSRTRCAPAGLVR